MVSEDMLTALMLDALAFSGVGEIRVDEGGEFGPITESPGDQMLTGGVVVRHDTFDVRVKEKATSANGFGDTVGVIMTAGADEAGIPHHHTG